FRPNALGTLDSIKTSQLPLFHTAAIHSSPADTGNSAITDSIRVVRMTVTGLYNDPDKGPIMKTVVSATKLLNAGMVQSTVCGDVPLAVTTATATLVNAPVAPFLPVSVHLAWNSSLDQDNGEKDVQRYLVYKKLSASGDWGSPIADLAASQVNYTLDDTSLSNGTWVYGIVAQDCSPTNSSITSTGAINVAGLP
ncbi:MAG: hypothetical protein ACRENC_14615, partial [Gemmatimonadaceae bacterium]